MSVKSRLKKLNNHSDECYFGFIQVRKLTPYLDDIKIPRRNKNIHKKDRYLDPKSRCLAWYYCHNGSSKTDAYLRAYKGIFDKKTQRLVVPEESLLDPYAAQKAAAAFRKSYVMQAVEIIKEELQKDIKADISMTVLDQLYVQATFDVGIFYNADGSIAFSDWNDIPYKYRCCVESMEVKYYGKNADQKVVNLKLVDRNQARKELAKIAPDLYQPEKREIVHLTKNASGSDVGIDFSKFTDAQLKEFLKDTKNLESFDDIDIEEAEED